MRKGSYVLLRFQVGGAAVGRVDYIEEIPSNCPDPQHQVTAVAVIQHAKGVEAQTMTALRMVNGNWHDLRGPEVRIELLPSAQEEV